MIWGTLYCRAGDLGNTFYCRVGDLGNARLCKTPKPAPPQMHCAKAESKRVAGFCGAPAGRLDFAVARLGFAVARPGWVFGYGQGGVVRSHAMKKATGPITTAPTWRNPPLHATAVPEETERRGTADNRTTANTHTGGCVYRGPLHAAPTLRRVLRLLPPLAVALCLG